MCTQTIAPPNWGAIMCTSHWPSTISIYGSTRIPKTHLNAVSVTKALRKKYLDEHMKVHSDELKDECPHCGQNFKWRSSVAMNIKLKHPNLGLKNYFKIKTINIQFSVCANMLCTTKLAWPDTAWLYTH